jgi:hypothetical protein
MKRSSSPDDKVETVMTPPILLPVRRARFQIPDFRTPNLPACIFSVLVMLAAAMTALPVQGAEPPSCPACAAAPALPTADIVPDLPAKPPVPPNDPAVQARLPGCAVWTDRCVTCSRAAGGASCSNIGIACQPQPVECLQTEEEAKKLDEKAGKKPEN